MTLSLLSLNSMVTVYYFYTGSGINNKDWRRVRIHVHVLFHKTLIESSLGIDQKLNIYLYRLFSESLGVG